MNKITKIWVLWLALLTLTTALFANAGVNGDTKKVSLVLSWSNNTCVTSNFELGTKTMGNGATAFDKQTKDLTCEFLWNWASKVVLHLDQLSAGNWLNIAASNFSFSVTAVNTPTWYIGALAATGNTFAADRTIYTKEANKLWSWTTSLSISWTVPAFTAAWTYSGNLNVLIQAN